MPLTLPPLTINHHTVIPRLSRRAKNLTLRSQHTKGYIELVIPLSYRTPHHPHITRFLQQQQNWISQQVSTFSPSLPLIHNTTLTLEGLELTISHLPNSRSVPTISENTLFVGGKEEHTERRIKDFLKKRARSRLTLSVHHYTQKLNTPFNGSIRIVDTTSQWGSCKPKTQQLSFNWRLILAPPFVCDHVAAHEVAHLSINNHSKDFYRLLSSLDPHTPLARKWLKLHGHSLFAYARR